MLKRILLLVFISSVCGTTFDCRYDTLGWAYIGDLYSCFAKPRELTSDKVVESFYGTHQVNKTNDDVSVVSFENCQNLNFIPQGIHKIFGNLIGIRLYNCKVEEIGSFDLYDYPELKLIVIYGSLITNIPGEFFMNNLNLIYVNFNKNKIKNIGRGLLSGQKNLREVAMKNNLCINGGGIDENVSEFIDKLMDSCPEFVPTTTATQADTTEPTETYSLDTTLTESSIEISSNVTEEISTSLSTEPSTTTSSNFLAQSSSNFESTTSTTPPESSTTTPPESSTTTFTSQITTEFSENLSTAPSTALPSTTKESIPTQETSQSTTPFPSTMCFVSTTNSIETTTPTKPAEVSTTTTEKPENDEDICDIFKLNEKFEKAIERYLELSTRPCERNEI